MTARLAQAPLPWLPAGAAEVAPGVGLVALPDGGGAVQLHGMMTFCWEAGDEAGRRLAAVQLTEIGAATQQQVAAAFGAGPVTVWRWADAYRRGGLAGLLPARRGPKGPSKLTPELAGKIRELAGAGKSQAAVAKECGVSAFAVRTALGRVPARPAAAAPAREDTAGREPGGQEPAWTQDALPVLPDPVPRDGERALARFGLLGEGAAPVFVPGAKYPLAGLLLALPALAETGLLETARSVYGRLRNGFYGLEMMLVTLVFLALLREARAEGATRVPPAALGRVPVLEIVGSLAPKLRSGHLGHLRQFAGTAACRQLHIDLLGVSLAVWTGVDPCDNNRYARLSHDNIAVGACVPHGESAADEYSEDHPPHHRAHSVLHRRSCVAIGTLQVALSCVCLTHWRSPSTTHSAYG